MPRNNRQRLIRAIVPAVLVGAAVGGCSDLYTDRRETISFSAGDAVASNIAAQTIDPWPRHAENRQIETNGERTQKAIERYRTNKVTPLQAMGTSSANYAPTSVAPPPATSGNGQ